MKRRRTIDLPPTDRFPIVPGVSLFPAEIRFAVKKSFDIPEIPIDGNGE
jgi:hypothetical protein